VVVATDGMKNENMHAVKLNNGQQVAARVWRGTDR
jgi:hypothetical protein